MINESLSFEIYVLGKGTVAEDFSRLILVVRIFKKNLQVSRDLDVSFSWHYLLFNHLILEKVEDDCNICPASND